MAIVTKLVSDLSGKEGNQADFVKVIVRQHPAVDSPRQLDALPNEVKSLKQADELVVLEVANNGEKQKVVMTLAEFRKVCPDEVVARAQGTRGRRVGFSPASRSSKSQDKKS